MTEYVAQHREAVWLVGPLFASVTGLGIKEGLCYGTPAAAGELSSDVCHLLSAFLPQFCRICLALSMQEVNLLFLVY